ncbi:MAG: ARMT1-like domain-containing protein [Phototrophicaceae bacterium]
MQANPICTDKRFPFAHDTMKTRIPEIIRDIQARNTFSEHINHALDDLYHSLMTNAVLPPPDYLAPDASLWQVDFADKTSLRWQSIEWYFAEMHFFREIINRVQFWQTGHDPYHAMKNDELYSAGFKAQLTYALTIDGHPDDVLREMLHLSLWGNRIDLSLPDAMAHGQHVDADDLLIDESDAVVATILDGQGAVHIITDNFGTELAMDLMLMTQLVRLGLLVIVHVKMNPTYVSDATAADIRWMLTALPKIAPESNEMVATLQAAINRGQLRVQPDFFWHTSRFYDDLPSHIHKAFSQARVIISKGDANYRRAVYDTIWDVETNFSAIVAPIPAPFVALRTLKSDPIVGITHSQAAMLDREDSRWRVNGKRGVIQFSS